MLLFRSEEHVENWCAQRGLAEGMTFTLDQLWAVARVWHAGRADRGWRPRSPEKSQAIFTRAGLTGEFWDLKPT